MVSFAAVNWLAVLLGTLLSMALGALWYGPLFGQLWLKLIGKTEDELESNPVMYIKTAVAAFIGMLALKSGSRLIRCHRYSFRTGCRRIRFPGNWRNHNLRIHQL